MGKVSVFLVAAVLLGAAGLLAQTLTQPSGSQDALELQRTRERFVKERGAKTFYPADKFDLSPLPAYQPKEKVSGTLRIWGNNYLADSGLSDVWEAEFRKFHPDIRIEWTLKSAATAVGALWSGAADIGITTRSGFSFTRTIPSRGSHSVSLTAFLERPAKADGASISNGIGTLRADRRRISADGAKLGSKVPGQTSRSIPMD